MEKLPDEYKTSFAKGAKALAQKDVYKNQYEWTQIGLKNFKRRVLGFCGRETEKSLEELTEILMELKIVNSPKEGQKFVKGLHDSYITYGNGSLYFENVQSKEGKCCRIKRKYGNFLGDGGERP